EFSDELLRGESMLVRERVMNHDVVTRVVNLAVVVLERPAAGATLVQARRLRPGGREADAGARLPGIAGRPDESHFHSARRLLCEQLRFDENEVHFERDVWDVEETQILLEYPGLRTLCRRRLVRAALREGGGPRVRPALGLPCIARAAKATSGREVR
ncbi:unnamed protein product, partial [Prorocentrum cordatum]